MSFSNCEIECISKVITNFKCVFGIEPEQFGYYMVIPFGTSIESARTRWCKEIGIESRIPIYPDKRKRTRRDLMGVRITNQIVSKELIIALHKLEYGNELKKEFLIGFLRGLIAAEGAVIPGKKRKEVPNSIQFPQKGQTLPVIIKKILESFGVHGRVVLKQRKAEYYCVNITWHDNFDKFMKLGLADMHAVKKKKIETGLKSYVKVQAPRKTTSLKLLKILEAGRMSRIEIYENMGKTKQQINEMLYSKKKSFLLKNNYIEKIETEGSYIGR